MTVAIDVVDALVHGRVPDSPQTCSEALVAIKHWLATTPIDAAVVKELGAFARYLSALAQKRATLHGYGGSGDVAVDIVEAARTTGIHVYAIEHYLDYPLNPSSGESLFGVGLFHPEGVPLTSRLESGSLPFPQDLTLVRVYPTDDFEKVRALHRWLIEAGRDYQPSSRVVHAHWRWYLTRLRFLDHLATSLDLQVCTPLELGTPGLRRPPEARPWSVSGLGDFPPDAGQQMNALSLVVKAVSMSVSSTNPRSGSGDGGPGRYLETPDGHTFWFGVGFAWWGRYGTGPLWVQANLIDNEDIEKLSLALETAEIPHYPRVSHSDVLVPILPPYGTRREMVEASVGDQLQAVVAAIDGALPRHTNNE